ncbi:MAG: glycosyltransferase [Paracoccaceae bacterium]|nr:glycosyltransferase [Paracoccaceae bacterium]
MGGGGDLGPVTLGVAIPCYQGEAWVGRAVRSALAEGPGDLIVAVVDDGSTDGSAAAVRAIDDARVHLETGPNRGACAARNRGLALLEARGASHVLFLDADDYLEGGMLREAGEVAGRTGADMVLSDMHIEREGGREHRPRYEGEIAPETFFAGWMAGDYVNPSAILWRTAFLRAIGGWDESLSRAQDFDITMRAMFHAPRIVKNDRGAAIHAQINPSGVSKGVGLSAIDSRYRVVTGLMDRAAGTSFAGALPRLRAELYTIARAAFANGHVELGRRALARVRAEGDRGHYGTKVHRLAAGLFGLETKVRLWGR